MKNIDANAQKAQYFLLREMKADMIARQSVR
jgi:hypothetical protein